MSSPASRELSLCFPLQSIAMLQYSGSVLDPVYGDHAALGTLLLRPYAYGERTCECAQRKCRSEIDLFPGTILVWVWGGPDAVSEEAVIFLSFHGL